MLLDKDLKNLADQLHKSLPEERLVVYYGIGEIIITDIIKHFELETKDYELNLRIKIKKYTDYIGELAIIDRSLFESILVKILKFKLYKPSLADIRNNLNNIHDFNDITGVHANYGKIEIDTINKNIDLYKKAMMAMLNTIAKISENVENY